MFGSQDAPHRPCSPWEISYVEAFNGKLRNNFFNGEVFTTLKEALVLIADWQHHYNRLRPTSSLGYRPPALEV